MTLRNEAGNRVLGVDPSLNRTGWAVLQPAADGAPQQVANGIIAPRPGSRGDRLLQIRRQFEAVLQQWSPLEAYFEQPGTWQRRGGIRRETLEAMAMARGIMIAACTERDVLTFELDFQAVRQRLLGTRSSARIPVFLAGLGIEIPSRPRGGIDLDIANALLMACWGML